MRHRTDGDESVTAREIDVARACKFLPSQLPNERFRHRRLPRAGKTAAGSEVRNFEVVVVGFIADEVNFCPQALHAFFLVRNRHLVPEIHLVHDREHRNFKKNRMQPRAFDRNVDAVGRLRIRFDGNVLFLQMEKTQKIHEVAFDESESCEVLQFLILKAKTAEMMDFVTDFVRIRSEFHSDIAAAEPISHFRPRKLMQHALHHGEFIKIRVKQRFNNHVVYENARQPSCGPGHLRL